MKLTAALHVRIQTMLKDKSGATMIEYALMVTFIAMVAFAAVQTLGINLNAQYTAFSGLFP
jgi:Flp pilus assembly pilin Flp